MSKVRAIGPHSRPGKLAVVDGRSAEAIALQRVRAELSAHVGGQPSATQRMLIERCAVLSLRIQLMDRENLKDGMTERNAREYLAWTNSLSRLLRQLGTKGAPERPRTLADVIASTAKAAA